MRILVYSSIRAEKEGVGWFRDGTSISYFQNGIRKDKHQTKTLSTLSFEYLFPFEDDSVYFAYSIPFTYSDLTTTLDSIQSDPRKAQFG